MSSRGVTLGVSVALAVGLGVGGSQLEVPYVGLGPGPIFDTLGTGEDGRPLINVPADRDHPAKGQLYLTTVNVYQHLSLGAAISKWLDRDYAVVPEAVIFPQNQTEEEATEATRKEMVDSQDHAVTAALCELGTPVIATVVVEHVGDGTPAAKAGLRPGDTVTAIDGQPVDSLCTLRRLMRRHQPGDAVRMGYRRAARDDVADVRTKKGEANPDGAPMLGIGLAEKDQKPPFEVSIALERVGGPSAGLMFALGIYDRLTPGDLTGGLVIAGTGSIDDDGVVGAIGGIQQKLIAAKKVGARHFLTPDGNYDEALKARPDGLELVRVRTLRDALDALNRIAAQR